MGQQTLSSRFRVVLISPGPSFVNASFLGGQAEPLLNKVLRLREKVLGPDHVDAAESLINLAVLNNRKVC